jgi:HEAT repeat protein
LLLNESRAFVARQAAAEALGQIGSAEARQALQAALDDPLVSIHTAVQRALETTLAS